MTQQLHVWGYSEGCPACTDLKALLSTLGIPFVYHSITRGSPEREALRGAGFATVPQVFDPLGNHLGDLSTYRKAARLGIQGAGHLG